MHITTNTKDLQHLLEIISKISTKHITLPILQCVLLEVKNNILIIKATNLEIGIEGKLSVTQEEEGVIAVPAQILLQTINLITQQTITLTSEGDVLHVESQTSKTEIKSIPVDDFPNIPQVTGEAAHITGKVFALGIKTTANTASQSSIKPELGSIYIHQKKEHSLTFVATDSFRLMEKTIPQKNFILNDSILIPYKNALELARVVEDEDDVELYINENQCALVTKQIYITSRLISGTFPDYEQIIPKEYKTTITLLTKDLAHALKKTNIFLNKFMQLTVTISGGTFTLSAQSGEAGATTEAIAANVDGDDVTLNFNQRYVAEVVPHIYDESILIKCAGVGRPMVIQNVHDTSLRYLVMPMNK
ncbi:MAG: DNA polymerase III subunit beta [Candidatus Pacebacteria bacterium]|nr:DNA polymerase III subunit beta [Candidatus Paceibacterota bacterium]MCF7857311.1 DNA polymerase III subunit beta [Candidatus Paceibacterota bacterium]